MLLLKAPTWLRCLQKVLVKTSRWFHKCSGGGFPTVGVDFELPSDARDPGASAQLLLAAKPGGWREPQSGPGRAKLPLPTDPCTQRRCKAGAMHLESGKATANWLLGLVTGEPHCCLASGHIYK